MSLSSCRKTKVKKLINLSYLNNGESLVFRISPHQYILHKDSGPFSPFWLLRCEETSIHKTREQRANRRYEKNGEVILYPLSISSCFHGLRNWTENKAARSYRLGGGEEFFFVFFFYRHNSHWWLRYTLPNVNVPKLKSVNCHEVFPSQLCNRSTWCTVSGRWISFNKLRMGRLT